MKKWLFVVIGLALLAAAAVAVRQTGVDVVAMAGFKPSDGTITKAEGAKPAGGQRNAQAGGRGPLPVEIAKATSARLSDDIGAIGTLLADETVAIAPETSGRVGARFCSRTAQQVVAGHSRCSSSIPISPSADLAEAKARLTLAEANYDRNQTLRKSGNVAQSAYEAALTERDVARTAVESAEVRLDKLTILAPFSGTLGFRTISDGAYVTAGTALVQLDKIDRLQGELLGAGAASSRAIAPWPDRRCHGRCRAGRDLHRHRFGLEPSIDVNGRALQVRADLDNQRSEAAARPACARHRQGCRRARR